MKNKLREIYVLGESTVLQGFRPEYVMKGLLTVSSVRSKLDKIENI